MFVPGAGPDPVPDADLDPVVVFAETMEGLMVASTGGAGGGSRGGEERGVVT